MSHVTCNHFWPLAVTSIFRPLCTDSGRNTDVYVQWVNTEKSRLWVCYAVPRKVNHVHKSLTRKSASLNSLLLLLYMNTIFLSNFLLIADFVTCSSQITFFYFSDCTMWIKITVKLNVIYSTFSFLFLSTLKLRNYFCISSN